MRKRGRTQGNSSLSMQSESQQLTFLTYQEELINLKERRREQKSAAHANGEGSDEAEHRQFTQEEREHLKNAFRYICRLAFKESTRYLPKIRSFCSPHSHPALTDAELKDKLLGLLKDAEMISGERYFKEYLGNLEREDQAIIIRYMIWFLQSKYLRYLKRTECEKGKRKNMKKELYLRFKNEVMLPYLHNYLAQI